MIATVKTLKKNLSEVTVKIEKDNSVKEFNLGKIPYSSVKDIEKFIKITNEGNENIGKYTFFLDGEKDSEFKI